MATSSLPLRVLAAGLPLVLIAIVAGAAGYFTKSSPTPSIPPLPAAAERASGVQGAVQSFDGGQLTIASADGTQRTFDLTHQAVIEQLVTITRSDLNLGDWINGGAIPHRQTVLVLLGLVLISDPVVQTP